jgi:hypothetical protein
LQIRVWPRRLWYRILDATEWALRGIVCRSFGFFLPNAKSEPRVCLARFVPERSEERHES